MNNKKYRKILEQKNKKYEERATIISFILLAILITIALMISMNKLEACEVVEYTQYTVKAGDTVSGIAIKLAKNTDEDYRNIVIQIEKDNDLEDCMIYENDVLKIRK